PAARGAVVDGFAPDELRPSCADIGAGNDRLPRAGLALVEVDLGEVVVPRGDLLRGRQEPSVVRVHQHPTHRGAPPRLPRSCGPCGTVQVTRDLAERRAREKVSEDASHVGRLVLDDLEPGAVRVALRGGQPAVPVGRVAGAWVALLAPFDGVAARASGLDLHLALSDEDKLLEHEVVVLGVDSGAYGHDPD